MSIFTPIQQFADLVVYDWFSLSKDSHIGQGLNFFILDIVKIGILLVVINYFMAIVRYYLPVNKIRDILASRKWYGLDYLLAALFGVITPFCSCSSIPLFVGFVSAGIPLGVTFAFLITSPLVNESSLAIFPALFGGKITITYNVIGVLIGIIGGIIIGKLKMEKYIEPSFLKFKSREEMKINNVSPTFFQKIKLWWSEAWGITKSLLPYVLLGIGVGALIHGFVPTGFFERYLGGNQWWTVPVAAVIGVPLYANSVSVIPIMEALAGKGIDLGTIFAFMTGIVALSVPQLLILKRAMKLPLLLTFVGITTLGIIIMGYLFNIIF